MKERKRGNLLRSGIIQSCSLSRYIRVRVTIASLTTNFKECQSLGIFIIRTGQYQLESLGVRTEITEKASHLIMMLHIRVRSPSLVFVKSENKAANVSEELHLGIMEHTSTRDSTTAIVDN